MLADSKAHGISSRWRLKEDVGGLQTCHVEKALLKRVGLQKKAPFGSHTHHSPQVEEIRTSPPPPPTDTNTMRKQETSAMSRMKKDCLWLAASMEEGFGYVKARFISLTKKLTARNEKEATEADLMAAKMQVEAADAAEETKKRLDKSM
ncbi:uncharacterized protein LOC132191042 [Corylus avellana]|uniref:uncharacterized protein LOC132191042 n=1 Tax=Corylus avellana TaxID=13451 RepID=UPI00286A2A66|nr:uncharacterized protein LOC132191042 [Corylus avellana]